MTEVTIERLAAGGSGVGRLPDGMVVFVPRTAPGDCVSVTVTERRDRWARGVVSSVFQPSPHRSDPSCRHYVYDRCGGCQIQHLTPEAQLSFKREIVGDAIRRIGRRDCQNPPIEPAPQTWSYRRKITLAKGEGGEFGFHAFDDASRVFELEACPITHESVMELWGKLRKARQLFPRELDGITLSRGRDELLHVVFRSEVRWDVTPVIEGLGDPAICVWVAGHRGEARKLSGPVTDISPLSFEQTSNDLAHSIRSHVVGQLGDAPGIAWDLYGGFGDTALMLNERGFEVTSVEVDPVARRWGEAEAGGSNIRWVTGRVEQVIAQLSEPTAVVVNPPRTGLPSAVTTTLNRLFEDGGLFRLAYISCDPATLARDLTRIPNGEILDVRAYDLFPQTSHVETSVVLGPHA